MTRRYHLHIPGLVYIGVTLLVGFAAINGQVNLLFWIFGAMVALLLMSGLVSGVMMLMIDVRRLDPRHGSVGEPLVVRYALRNKSRVVPIFNVHVEELAGGTSRWKGLFDPARAWIMHVGPRETVHGEAVFWPRRRGEARFDRLRVWTTFPFGLIKKSITIRFEQHTLIYPRLYELHAHVLSSVSPEGIVGTRLAQNAGAGDDYYGMRDYRPGDSMRNVSWKRSASRDELVLIERTRPSPPKVRIVLDLTVATNELQPDEGDDPRDLEEQAISLAASLAHHADLRGYEVGLSAWGIDLPPIPLRRNHWHLAKILGALAAIDLDAERAPRSASSVPDAERAGLVIIHPDRVRGSGLREGAMHLTARQLERVSIRAIGWDPSLVEPAPTGRDSEAAA